MYPVLVKSIQSVFAQNLGAAIKASGKKPEEIADLIPVDHRTMGKWLYQETWPGIDKIQKLSQILGISETALFFDQTLPSEKMDRKAIFSEAAEILEAYGRAAPDIQSEVRKTLGLAPGPDFEKLRRRARNILQTQEKTPPKASEDD